MTFFYRLCFIVFKSFCILYPSGLEQKQINKKKNKQTEFPEKIQWKEFNEGTIYRGCRQGIEQTSDVEAVRN